MPFCSNCGAEVSGGFCGNCGTPVGGTAPAGGPTPAGGQPPAASSGLDQNLVSMLCYLGGIITGIIFLVLAPYSQDKTIRFHAFQSIFTFLGLIVFQFVWIILTGAVSVILGFLGALMGLVFPIYGLLCLGLWIYLMVSAYQGKRVVLPIVGPMAEKQV